MGVVSKKTNNTATVSLPSVTDEQFEGDEPLTPTDKMQDDVEDDDDLSALNSILQGGSPGTLSDEEHESASPLSSAPDDFPMSRSASPENNTRKRKSPANSVQLELKTIHEETTNKKRRVSRSTLEITESTRTLRRSSKQEEKQASPKKPIEEEKEEEQKEQEPEPEKEKEQEEDTDMTEKDEEKEPLEQNDKAPEETPTAEPEKVEDQEEEEEEDANEAQEDNSDHDYQQRHKEALDALASIEVEFARLRDKMYQEKMAELNEEAVMIANGTHPELVSLMAEIEEKKGNRIQNAEAWRRHQHANFKQQFEGLEYQANIHFISQKNALRRNLLNGLNGQKWSIEDERCKLNDPSREDPIYPDGRVLSIHKKEQKEETDELQDIKEAIGFPMAPNPNGLKTQDIDNDLKLLGLGR